MATLSVLITLLGSVLFYLTFRHQQWRNTPLPPRLWRIVAAALILAGTCGWGMIIDPLAALFVQLTLLMVFLGLIPLLPVNLLRRHR